MNRFKITNLPLTGLKLIERKPLGDHRGFLTRLFCAQELAAAGWDKPIAQINHSYTAKQGTLRGLHFQHPPYAEMKLVSCIRGAVWDLALDLRQGSPTFLQWHAQQLSAENNCALLIPQGFAHGFQTLRDDVELLYCHSMPYEASAEAGLQPTDPGLGIPWPQEITEISARDTSLPLLDDQFEGIRL